MPVMMMTAAPVKEKTIRETETTERRNRKQLTTLGRRVNDIAWTKQVFRALGKSMPGRGRGPRLADIR